MPKTVFEIEVVEVNDKTWGTGYKVYITDDHHQGLKFPRKPGDLKGREPAPPGEPLAKGFYPLTVVASVEQALRDYQLWKDQGYKSAALEERKA